MKFTKKTIVQAYFARVFTLPDPDKTTYNFINSYEEYDPLL